MQDNETPIIEGFLSLIPRNKNKSRNPFGTIFTATPQRLWCVLLSKSLLGFRTSLTTSNSSDLFKSGTLSLKASQTIFMLDDVVGCNDGLTRPEYITIHLVERNRSFYSTLELSVENPEIESAWRLLLHKAFFEAQNKTMMPSSVLNNNVKKFDKILTHNLRIFDKSPNARNSNSSSNYGSSPVSFPTIPERQECWQALAALDEVPLYCAGPEDLFLRRVVISHPIVRQNKYSGSKRVQQHSESNVSEDMDLFDDTDGVHAFGIALICVGRTVLRFFPCLHIDNAHFDEIINYIPSHMALPVVGISRIATQGRNSDFTVEIERKGPMWTPRERIVEIHVCSCFRDEIIQELRSLVSALRPGWPALLLHSLDIPFSLRSTVVRPKFNILKLCAGSKERAFALLLKANLYIFNLNSSSIHFRIISESQGPNQRNIFVLLPSRFQSSQQKNPPQYTIADIATVFEALKFTTLVNEISFRKNVLYSLDNSEHNFFNRSLTRASHGSISISPPKISVMRVPSTSRKNLFRKQPLEDLTESKSVDNQLEIGTLLGQLISSNFQIQSVDLFECNLSISINGGSHLKNFFTAIQEIGSNLRDLNLGNNPIGTRVCELIAAIPFLKFPLRRLTLRNTNISHLNELFEALMKTEICLEYFDVGKNFAQVDSSKVLNFFEHALVLKCILLEDCYFGVDQLNVLPSSELFSSNWSTSLEVIDFSNVTGLWSPNLFSMNILCSFISDHQRCFTLSSLKLRNTNLTGSDFALLLNSITRSRANVREKIFLDGSHNPLAQDGWEQLCYALGEGEGPRFLSLKDVVVEKLKQISEFFTCLSTNRNLVKLNISGLDWRRENQIRPKKLGWRKTFTFSSQITHVDDMDNVFLDPNQILVGSIDACNALGSMFARNMTLKELILQGPLKKDKNGEFSKQEISSIGYSWGIYLDVALRLLRVNRTLECLDLRGQGFGNSGAISLADALRQNLGLKVLKIDLNGIGLDGLLVLSTALSANTNLVDCAFPAKDALKIQDSLNSAVEEARSRALLLASVPFSKDGRYSTGTFLMIPQNMETSPPFTLSNMEALSTSSNLDSNSIPRHSELKFLQKQERAARKSFRSLQIAMRSFVETVERNKSLSISHSSSVTATSITIAMPTDNQLSERREELQKVRLSVKSLVSRNQQLRELVGLIYENIFSPITDEQISISESIDGKDQSEQYNLRWALKEQEAVEGFVGGIGVLWEMPWTCDVLITKCNEEITNEVIDILECWDSLSTIVDKEIQYNVEESRQTNISEGINDTGRIRLFSILGQVLDEINNDTIDRRLDQKLTSEFFSPINLMQNDDDDDDTPLAIGRTGSDDDDTPLAIGRIGLHSLNILSTNLSDDDDEIPLVFDRIPTQLTAEHEIQRRLITNNESVDDDDLPLGIFK